METLGKVFLGILTVLFMPLSVVFWLLYWVIKAATKGDTKQELEIMRLRAELEKMRFKAGEVE